MKIDPEGPTASEVTQPMGAFAVTLESLIADRKISARELAEATGIADSQLSRYLRQGQLPELDPVEKLCTYFGDEAAALLAAYLRDHIPAKFTHLVTITPATGTASVREDLPSIIDSLPRKLQGLIEATARECVRRPTFIKHLESAIDLSRQ